MQTPIFCAFFQSLKNLNGIEKKSSTFFMNEFFWGFNFYEIFL